MFLIKKDNDMLTEFRFLKDDKKYLCKEFKNILLEQNEQYLDYIKNEEKSITEKIANKQMDQYFAVMFEDVRHERSLTLLLSLTDPYLLRQQKLPILKLTL